MNCEHAKELLLTDTLDGEAQPTEAEALRLHLDSCPSCRAYAVSVREATIAPFARLTPRKPSPELWQRILTAIRAESPVIREPLPSTPAGWSFAIPQLKQLFRLVPAFALAGILVVVGSQWLGKPIPAIPPTLIALQRQVTAEELLFDSNPAVSLRILRGMGFNTPVEKLFL